VNYARNWAREGSPDKAHQIMLKLKSKTIEVKDEQ
jgi:hypothetical protein